MLVSCKLLQAQGPLQRCCGAELGRRPRNDVGAGAAVAQWVLNRSMVAPLSSAVSECSLTAVLQSECSCARVFLGSLPGSLRRCSAAST